MITDKNQKTEFRALFRKLYVTCRFTDRRRKKKRGGSLHTTELDDGQEWNRIDFNSITEQTHLDEFLETAELAGTEFQAVKLNMNFARPTTLIGQPSESERNKIKEVQEANRSILRIPRRPPWNILTTAEMLAESERSTFLEWRRSLAQLEENQNILLTPFERNLHFWRQLWRVIEKSDVVIQIVDARNPLLFRCEDLEAYVKEVSPLKDNLILVNKSDLLTESEREAWAAYFRNNNINAVFFSALEGEELDIIREEEEIALKENNDENLTNEINEDDSENEDSIENEKEYQDENETDNRKNELSFESEENNYMDQHVEECRYDIENFSVNFDGGLESCNKNEVNTESTSNEKMESNDETSDKENPLNSKYVTTSKLFSRVDLISLFKVIHEGKRVSEKHVTIGLVGYPNVGKSSTINCLMKEKKVSVSATPGKTKHFQTLFLNDDILLCDCPGLVFPAFVATKAEMIISGILPIDQMRDHVPSINLVTSIYPRDFLENTYSIRLPKPLEGEDPNRPPTSEEFLNTYGFLRGFMTQRGQPDNPRTARYVLKDYMNGKLLYCHAPPNYPQEEYHKYKYMKYCKTNGEALQLSTSPYKEYRKQNDRIFFKNKVAGNRGHRKILAAGVNSAESSEECSSEGSVPFKPWRNNTKRNSKQKARKQFAHLDPKTS
ncbi:unnamed protein product, partial [Meganyctiphanes norvegica]